MMLDSKYYNLILKIFQYFFATVSMNHEGNVVTSNVDNYYLVLIESDDIPRPLLLVLLVVMRKDDQEVLSIAHALVKNVVKKCKKKLKPT